MIEFLMMAFFVAQPTPSPGAADGGTRSSALGPVALRDPVEISARLVTGERNQAVFTGDVLAKHRTMELRCERMVAYYNEPRAVTRVECTGGVQVQDGDRFARGERADYDVPSGVLVVTGSPEARQGTTYVTGTKVRLTLGNERLEVENARIIVETAPPGAPKRGKGGTRKP